jgi:diguanylate cyclase (GGDEF)-like protein
VLLTTIEVMIHAIIVVPIIGWHAGFQYYLIGAVPVTLFNNRLRTPIIIFLSASLFILYILLYTLNHDAGNILGQPVLAIINYFNIFFGFTALVVTSYFFRIASMMAEEEMEILATTDTLTGLFNRRKMTELLESQKVLFERTDLRFSIVLADIDHFKRVNDSFGHDCGDYVLREVAKLMRERLRQSDVLARWGGEEFLIMLPDSDAHAAKLVAEVLRHSIEQKIMQCSGEDVSVTMSMGVAEHQANNTLNASLKAADEALYQAKEGGRNRVMG